MEFDLLACLSRVRSECYASRLIARVWGDGFAITDRTIDSHVKPAPKLSEPSTAEHHRNGACVGYRVKSSLAPNGAKEDP